MTNRIWLIVLTGVVLGYAVATTIVVRDLDHKVNCLEHPYAASSITATRVNGKFVITKPAHKTDCLHPK